MPNDIQETSMHLAQQRFKLRVWITSRLWAQVIAGMVLGFGLGLVQWVSMVSNVGYGPNGALPQYSADAASHLRSASGPRLQSQTSRR